MTFAVDLNRDDHAAALELLASVDHWHQPTGRKYFTGPLRLDQHPLLKGAVRAFFLKIEPGGHIHRHVDSASALRVTDLIVVSTNDACWTSWKDEAGEEHSMHLELGHRYRMQDRGLEHWAVNFGDTDRAHLVIEYPK